MIYYIHGSPMMKWNGDEHVKIRNPVDESFLYRLESVYGSVYLQFHLISVPGYSGWINICSM